LSARRERDLAGAQGPSAVAWTPAGILQPAREEQDEYDQQDDATESIEHENLLSLLI
jgi:hypothetical protein